MSAIPAPLSAIMQPSRPVQLLRDGIDTLTRGAEPLVDLGRPYVDGQDRLPADGRFLLVGNHTMAGVEGLMIPHFVRRAIGHRVRPLVERKMAEMPAPGRAVIAAYGGVVGSPDNAGELMRHNQPILVFPGGGRELTKFKGEQYQLRWAGRSGFARIAIAHDYPIVPVALVGGDDVYRPLVSRDSTLGQWSLRLNERLIDRSDTPLPLIAGIGPTPIPIPQRMYLRFGAPIDTTRPAERAEADWIDEVKAATQSALEAALAGLLEIRATDPYRHLNPLAWHRAVRGATG